MILSTVISSKGGFMIKLLVVLVVSVFFIGCDPTITDLQVTPTADASVATVSAKVMSQGSSNMSTPSAAWRVSGSGASFAGETPMNPAEDHYYSIDLTGLPTGFLDVRVWVTYGSSGDLVKERIVKFYNGAYFGFDSVQGTAGWSFQGIYNDNGPEQIAQCPPAGLDTFPSRVHFPDFALESYPSPAGSYRGALFVFTHPGCFPNTTTLAMGPLWRYALVSPDLSGETAWQGITGFSCRFQSNRPGITVKPLIRVRKTDGDTTHFTGADPAFYPIDSTGIWYEVIYTLPAGASALIDRILNVQVNVFGDAVMTGTYPEGANYLDAVYPIH